MADLGLTILDGAQLREADVSLPTPTANTVITGAEVLELAETRCSLFLHGYVLPETVKSSALRCIGVSDVAGFRSKNLDYSDASSILRNYISAIADELRDDPIAVAILDGRTLHMFLEDEDDFAMLAENLFTDLDVEDRGKISKDEILTALIHMGVESGIPPISEFPNLSDILKKHGAVGNEELGQAQFAQLLQPVLQELADCLAKTPAVVVMQHIGVVNGSKLRKILDNKRLLDEFFKKITHEEYKSNSEQPTIDKVKSSLEKHGDDLGLPASEINGMEVYTEILAEVNRQNDAVKSEKDAFMMMFNEVLEKLAENLEKNPIFYDLQS